MNQTEKLKKIQLLNKLGFLSEKKVVDYKIIKILDRESLIEGYTLVHDIYVQKQYIKNNKLRLRIRDFELSDHITTFAAIYENQIIGLISIINDSSRGLPSDESFRPEIDRIRGGKIVEISNQIVIEKYRNTNIAFELMKAVLAYAIESKIQGGIAAINKTHLFFYELLGFEKIGEEKSSSKDIYDPVVLVYLNTEKYTCPKIKLDFFDTEIKRILIEDNKYFGMYT